MPTALVVLVLAHAALADSRHVAVPVGGHSAVPVRSGSHSAQPVHQAVPVTTPGHAAHPARGSATASAGHTSAAAVPGSGHPHHRHRHGNFVAPNGEDGVDGVDAYSVGYGCDGDDCPGTEQVETWDQPVDAESPQAGDDPADADSAEASPDPAAPMDCDGGSGQFRVDDGSGDAPIYRWVDADGTEHFSDAASIPDSARASARTTKGDPIVIAPHPQCAPAAAGN